MDVLPSAKASLSSGISLSAEVRYSSQYRIDSLWSSVTGAILLALRWQFIQPEN